MWFKEYRDYPIDAPLKKERSPRTPGVSGCEMSEPNGWGETFDRDPPYKEPFLKRLLKRFF